MVRQEDEQRLLEFVEENERVNTFHLARELKMERHLVLRMIDQLQKKGAVDYRSGTVTFLSYPKEESVTTKEESVTKIVSPSLPVKKKAIPNPMLLLAEQSRKLSEKNKQLKQQLEQAYEQVKELAQYKEMIGDHTAQIETLKSQLETAQKKAEKKPKIVEKVIVKKVYVPRKQEEHEPAQEKKISSVHNYWDKAGEVLKNMHTRMQDIHLPESFQKK
ncbi:hypothetical protein HZB00_01145 [Candidatus Woesearchaeota archaeon]|nr:hypothetical protein [Candidatus Woesearchaeota archaeon]